jgi:hypothetical protein
MKVVGFASLSSLRLSLPADYSEYERDGRALAEVLRILEAAVKACPEAFLAGEISALAGFEPNWCQGRPSLGEGWEIHLWELQRSAEAELRERFGDEMVTVRWDCERPVTRLRWQEAVSMEMDNFRNDTRRQRAFQIGRASGAFERDLAFEREKALAGYR